MSGKFYVFEVHIKPGHTAEQCADAWVRASEIIQQAPGAHGTRLHRMLDRWPPATVLTRDTIRPDSTNI